MAHIRLHPSAVTVPYASGDTVLETLERAGYAMPNNCRAGACGECKVKIRSGEYDQGFILDMALSQEERAQGYGLICMAKLTGEELEVEWGTADALPRLYEPRDGQLFVLVDRVRRSPAVTEIALRPAIAPMRYWPGQYVLIDDPTGGAQARAHFLTGAPHPDGELRVQVLGDALAGTALGSPVTLSGPYGTFIGDPSARTPVLALADEVGLAPILSLTEAALRRGYAEPVTVVAQAGEPQDLHGLGLLGYWQARYRNFRWMPTLTGPRVAGMRHGRIPDMLPELVVSLREHAVFIAGRPGFVTECLAAADALGADAGRMMREEFGEQPDG